MEVSCWCVFGGCYVLAVYAVVCVCLSGCLGRCDGLAVCACRIVGEYQSQKKG